MAGLHSSDPSLAGDSSVRAVREDGEGTPSSGAGTRERLLDAAEQLFADHGISGSSLRAVTRAAGVNLAAVHYHFGSKEALLDAVVERRAQPLNRRRLEALDGAVAAAAPDPPPVEAILRAFLEPGMQLHAEEATARRLSRLVARVEAQPAELIEPIYRKHMGDVSRRFVEALQGALPGLSRETVGARYRFSLGCLSYVFAGGFELDVIPGHPAPCLDERAKLRHVIAFLSGGLSAPECEAPGPEEVPS